MLGGIQRCSVAYSGARRRSAPAAARRCSRDPAAICGARWHSAALGGGQRPRQRGGSRQHVAQSPLATLVSVRGGARRLALGGVPFHSAELRSPRRHSEGSTVAPSVVQRHSMPAVAFGGTSGGARLRAVVLTVPSGTEYTHRRPGPHCGAMRGARQLAAVARGRQRRGVRRGSWSCSASYGGTHGVTLLSCSTPAAFADVRWHAMVLGGMQVTQ